MRSHIIIFKFRKKKKNPAKVTASKHWGEATERKQERRISEWLLELKEKDLLIVSRCECL